MGRVTGVRGAAVLVAGGIALAASAPPAAAYWQYTRWGMSPAQVVAASEGTAVANADRTLDSAGLKAELKAPYKGSSLAYTAVFLFDTKDQLQYVTLDPLSQDSCPAILATLTTNYGTPQLKDSSNYATTVRWQDLGNNNTVIYFDLGGGNCSIQYSRLPPTPSDGGL